MPNPKNKTNSDLSNELQKIMTLTEEQLKSINELETDFFRAYMFSIDPKFSERGLKFKFIRKLLKLLSGKQIEKLKSKIQAAKKKNQIRKAKQNQNIQDHQRQRFARLNMDEPTFEKFSVALDKANQMVMEQGKAHILARKPTPYDRRYQFQLISKELLAGILNPEQWLLFLNIQEEEEKANQQRCVEMKINQYQLRGIVLNHSQAARILEFENERGRRMPNGKVLSEWETMDRKWDFMKTILKEEQLEVFKLRQDKRREQILKDQNKSDARYVKQIQRNQNYLEYIRAHYLPVLCERRAQLDALLSTEQKENIDILREVYRSALKQHLQHIRSEHERFYLGLKTNEFRTNELRVQAQLLIPNARYIKDDARCRALLSPAIEAYLSQPSPELKQAQDDLHAFNIRNYEATGGEYGAWMTVIRSKENPELNFVSTLLLYPEVESNIKQANH